MTVFDMVVSMNSMEKHSRSAMSCTCVPVVNPERSNPYVFSSIESLEKAVDVAS